MSSSSKDTHLVDHVSLCWTTAWCVVLTIAAISILQTESSDSLADGTQSILGIILGGISAAWALLGTWLLLMDLPHKTAATSSESPHSRQRMRPRVGWLIAWMINIVVLAVSIYDELTLLLLVALTTVIGITLPAIATQWTRQRIRRGTATVPQKRSIRQMLGMATSIALLIAMIRWSGREFSLPESVTTVIAATAMLWFIMTLLILGRWWGLILLTLPLAAGLWFAVQLVVETQANSRNLNFRILDGMIWGFFFFSLVFLMMLRSSGHRWIISLRPKSEPSAGG